MAFPDLEKLDEPLTVAEIDLAIKHLQRHVRGHIRFLSLQTVAPKFGAAYIPNAIPTALADLDALRLLRMRSEVMARNGSMDEFANQS